MVKCTFYCVIATTTGCMFKSEERKLFFYDFKLNVESMWSLYGVRKSLWRIEVVENVKLHSHGLHGYSVQTCGQV